MNTRAIASFAWVAGPPLATLIMGVLGNRSILPVLAGVGLLNVATTLIMISGLGSAPGAVPAADAGSTNASRSGRPRSPRSPPHSSCSRQPTARPSLS